MTIRTRFAPSPTGFLHIGGVRTALFCWLHARGNAGEFVLRIEDTDRERSTQESTDIILEGLDWVGLQPDDGPYYQSRRFDRYREQIDALLAKGAAYRCYCSPAELDEMRAAQVAAGKNPRYDGRCRERAEPVAGRDPVVRFRTPDEGVVVVDDLVRGRVEFANEELDDLIIQRADGWPTYHFGVVVDDADMHITHVIRGDDHLNNTPRQIHIIDALGESRPAYAHLPMILGEDGARLSKRHGSVNVLEYREQGYLPEALLNYLARLGWSHGDQEIFSLDEMVELFDISDVNASASKFNPEKLRWVNQQYIQSLPAIDLAPLLEEQLRRLALQPADGPAADRVVEAYRDRAQTMAEMANSATYLFRDFSAHDEKAAKKHLRPVVGLPLADLRERLAALDEWAAPLIHAAIDDIAQQHDMGFGKLGQPLRVAVTGGSVSPPIDVTVELVGRPRSLARLDMALEYIGQREQAG